MIWTSTSRRTARYPNGVGHHAYSLLLALTTVAGCAAPGATIDSYAVNTPDVYTEAKVLYLGPKENATPTRRKLYHSYEVGTTKVADTSPPSGVVARGNLTVAGSGYVDVALDGKATLTLAGTVAPDDQEVKRLDPIGVIVRGVRLPEDMEGRRDVAVVLNVATTGTQASAPIVAYYQRDVPGGQMLLFADLLVYYDPSWDGRTPPFFRVRVLEVNKERNQRTREFLEESSKLPDALGGSIPHPVLPIVRTAMEAAKLVLANKNNRVIVDYEVQFYSKAQIEGAGDSVLSPLRRGEWLVVGRPKGVGSEFWNADLELDLRTGMVHSGKNAQAPSVHVPYVAVTLMCADAVVPKYIMDRSQSLIDILSSATERSNLDSLVASVAQLNSAAEGYRLEQQLRKYGSKADFVAIVTMIQGEKQKPTLSTEEVRRLVRLVDLVTPDDSLGTVEDVDNWWRQTGVAEGSLVEDRGAPLGVVWRKKQ